MQDIHSIGGGGGGDRRLRPQHHGNGPPALKCPRCESLNTKFCYYNNYNLSQPRHFCKSCRRYWTKGGVLRNVPVGGGCRKKKRSKPKSGNRNPSSVAGERKSSKSENASSDSSSLTATTTATNTTAKTTATAPVTVAEPLLHFPEDSTGFFNIPNPSFDRKLPDLSSAGNNMLPEINTLITSSTAHLPPEFNISAGISPFRLHHAGRIVENSNSDQQQWMVADNTPPAEFFGLPEKITGGGIGTEDWNNCTDEAFFDLKGTVDQLYRNQSEWDDRRHHDHELDYFR